MWYVCTFVWGGFCLKLEKFADLLTLLPHFPPPIANQCAIVRKYHLDMCRQCLRERAKDIGFVKYD